MKACCRFSAVLSCCLSVILAIGMMPAVAFADGVSNAELNSASEVSVQASPQATSLAETAECLSLYDFFVDMDSDRAILQFTRSDNGTLLTEINEATHRGKAGDATDCRNVLRALDTIRDLNEVRASLGLNELLVSDELMARETVSTNWSASNIAHSTGSGAENLAWGWDKPVEGWYASEKITWDKALESGTYKGEALPEGWQTMSASKLNASVPDFYHAVGHYLNCIDKTYKYAGAACNTAAHAINGIAMGQTYRSYANDNAFTVDEWEARLRAWMAEQEPVYIPVDKPAVPAALVYNGQAQAPLAENKAYSLEGQTSETNAGTYRLTASPNEGYCWSDGTRDAVEVIWEIQRQKVEKPTCTGSFTYSGVTCEAAQPYNPPEILYIGGSSEKPYVYSGTRAATAVGTYVFRATLNSNYQWSDGTVDPLSFTWFIEESATPPAEDKRTISAQTLGLPGVKVECLYTGGPITNIVPVVHYVEGGEARQLTEGIEYKLEYHNNTAVGTGTVTIKGIGDYDGEFTHEFKIYRGFLDDNNLEVDLPGSVTYTGQLQKPVSTVRYKGTLLKEGVDYQVSYRDNTNVGRAWVTITGIGAYAHTWTFPFSIVAPSEPETPGSGGDETVVPKPGDENTPSKPGGSIGGSGSGTGSGASGVGSGGGSATSGQVKPMPDKLAPTSIGGATVTVANAVWTGKTRKPSSVVVKLGGKTLRQGTDYAVSCKGGKKIGSYTVVVRGIGSYTGTKTAKFNVVPKSVTAKKPAVAKRGFTAKWAHPSSKYLKQTTGYQVQWSTDKKFKKAVKSKLVKGAKKTSLKVGKLKAKKTYYVKVRAYKQVGKTKYYSAWSKVQKVKTK